MYASGGLCKSSLQAAYRNGCHLLRLVCISGLCQQSHVLALSLLLVVAGDVETNPGPLDGRCAIYMLYTTCMMELDHTLCAMYMHVLDMLSYLQFKFGVLSTVKAFTEKLTYVASKECDL